MTAALLLAGCGAPERMPAPAAGPDMRATAAPGVAISYRHTFRLPAVALAASQAAACRGLRGARPIALPYRRHPVSLPRRHGGRVARPPPRAGGGTAVRREGDRRRSGCRGHADLCRDRHRGGGCGGAAATRANAAEDATLARAPDRPGQGDAGRAHLRARRAALAEVRRTASAAAAAARLKLAATPMRFDYEAGRVDARVTDGPMRAALRTGWANVVDGTATMLMLLISALPWFAGMLAAVWLTLLARWVGRRLRARYGETD